MRLHIPPYEASRTTLCGFTYRLRDFTYQLMKLELSRRPRRHIGRWSHNSSIVILCTPGADSFAHRTLQLRGM